ncbi:MAG TPA: GNAT family N-acetyltransferase, partial [Thermomicrobiales bacterium]|nr:GNAT family N-acetyltransferase [Thermomicrobiales bacterium]
MPSDSPFQADMNLVAVRPLSPEDRPFLARIASRMNPGQTASPRDPEAFDRFFSGLGDREFLTKPGAQAYVATIGNRPCGFISFYPDKDYFTDHPRAYIDNLVVAEESERKGVGRTLLDFVERWARDHGFREDIEDDFTEAAVTCPPLDEIQERAPHSLAFRFLDHYEIVDVGPWVIREV